MFRVVILVLRAMPLPRIKQMIMHMKLNFDSVTQAEISVRVMTWTEISVTQAEIDMTQAENCDPHPGLG